MFTKMCTSILISVLFVFMFTPLGYSFISSMLPGHQGKWEYVENHSLLETNAAGVEGRETLSNRSSNLISMLSNEDDLMFLLFAPEGTVYFSLGEIYNININVDSKSFEVKASRITTADYMLAIFPTDELIEAMKTGNQIVINAQHRKFIFTLNGSKEAITKVVENKWYVIKIFIQDNLRKNYNYENK